MSEPVDKNPSFLVQRFPGLSQSKEVNQAVRRTEKQQGKRVDKTPEDRVQNYLDRFTQMLSRTDSAKTERGITALKKVLTDKFIVRREDIPERYWETQMKVLHSRGQSGDWQSLTEEEATQIKEEHLTKVIEDQKGSLEEWVDYLASDASQELPDYFKYWVFAGMLKLERYEKGDKSVGKQGRFPERPTGRQRSVKMFPEVNARGLEFLAEAFQKQENGQEVSFRYDIPKSAQNEFKSLLPTKDFRKLYSWLQEYLPPISEEEMRTTQGEWTTFTKGDEQILTESLHGKGSGWCIAGESLASSYLSKGKLHVYYTKDKFGNPTVPRVVVVQIADKITEVRGIEWEENVDEYIKRTDIINEKLATLPGGEEFFATDQDTKQLTSIDKKVSQGSTLTREELIFLYEADRPIKYFGYKKDPRINKIRQARDQRADLCIVLGTQDSPLREDEIALERSEVTKQTKVYVGPLSPGIFNELSSVEHIYSASLESSMVREEIVVGRYGRQQLIEKVKQKSNITDFSEEMIAHPDFMPKGDTLNVKLLSYFKGETVNQVSEETISVIRLKVKDLGFTKSPTTTELFERAQEYGLELCPPEVGPYYRLQYTDQPMNEWIYVGMKPISVAGNPRVFSLGHYEGGLWLRSYWARPSIGGILDEEFVFRLRKDS